MSELDDAKAEIKRLCKGELMLDLTFTKRMCAALDRPLSSGFSVNDVTEYVKGLEADAKRLDWLEQDDKLFRLNYQITREAIDAAMKEPAK